MRNLLCSSVALVAILATAAPTATAAASGKKAYRTLEYNLPKVKVGFAVSHTITSCPVTVKDTFAMDIATAIKPVYSAGETIKIDATGKALVDRTIKLEFYPNGTLKSFNGGSTGQGGPLLTSAIKLATFIGAAKVSPLAAAAAAGSGGEETPSAPEGAGGNTPPSPPPPPHPLQCHDWVIKSLDQKKKIADHLETLESSFYMATSTEALTKQIEAARGAIAAINARLTILGKPQFWTPSADAMAFAGTAKSGDLKKWFKSWGDGTLEDRLNNYGYGQTQDFTLTGKLTPDAAAFDEAPVEAVKKLVYRVPRGAVAKIKPTADFDDSKVSDPVQAALTRYRHKATNNTLAVKVPQMGALKQVPFSGSGIFGSRSVGATFSEVGELTMIDFASNGGAAAMAGVVDTVTASAAELRDAKFNAVSREFDLRSKQKELEDLINGAAQTPED